MLAENSELPNFEHLLFYPSVKGEHSASVTANFGQSKFKFDITDYIQRKIIQSKEVLPSFDTKPNIFSVGSNLTDEFGHPILGKLFTVKTGAIGVGQKVSTFANVQTCVRLLCIFFGRH